MNDNHDLKKLLSSSLETIEAMEETIDRFHQPIAIISMACRFPGGNNTPEEFWDFLLKGGDGISSIPSDRWNNKAFYKTGKDYSYYVQEGGFISQDIKTFDARLFGISPKEVEEMDPQQRILLEVSWELFERGGYSLSELKNKNVGVFVGAIGSEFSLLHRPTDQIGSYASTGMISNILSGRLAYLYGLLGPAITLDTACSSSLVSLHLACKSIQSGECDMAIAGGVNILLTPLSFTMLCKMQALAKDGRCKSFSATGDGYGRGEGCGLVLLKPLDKALADNDPILAVYRGSAVNQDGPSSGLTVPSGPAQQRLMLSALKDANLESQDISALEAHGTGTPLGDPIEFDGIATVYGRGRKEDNPLLLTSVKANIGHLEGAAGIAGIIKAILCLQNKYIPPQIHLNELNPRINLKDVPATITRDGLSWDTKNQERYIGISSFGFSGTNSHIILGEAPNNKTSSSDKQVLNLFTFSAKDKKSLEDLAQKHIHFLKENPTSTLPAVCYSANKRRNHFNYRMALVTNSLEDVNNQLENFIHTNQSDNVIDLSLEKPLEIAYVFNFSEFPLEYTKDLAVNNPSYKAILLDVLNQTPQEMSENVLILNFLCQAALIQWFKKINIQPTVVATSGAGMLIGAMAAEVMDFKLAFQYFLFYFVKDANSNVPTGKFGKQKFTLLDLYTGEEISASHLGDPTYWKNSSDKTNINNNILKQFTENDINYVMDFTPPKNETLEFEKALSTENITVFNLQKSISSGEINTHLIHDLYLRNLDLNWKEFYSGLSYEHYNFPTYPFNRKKYWLNFSSTLDANRNTSDEVNLENAFYPNKINMPGTYFRFLINRQNLPDVADTNGVMHVGHYYALIKNCVFNLFSTETFSLSDVKFYLPVFIDENSTVDLLCEFNLLEEKNGYIKLYMNMPNKNWTLALSAYFSCVKNVIRTPLLKENIHEIMNHCKNHMVGKTFYTTIEKNTIPFGSSVKWIDNIWYKADEVFSEMRMPESSDLETIEQFQLPYHYGILDACAQLFNAIQLEKLPAKNIYMVSSIGNFVFSGIKYTGKFYCHCTSEDKTTPAEFYGSFYLYTDKGEFLASATDVKMMKVNIEHLSATIEGKSAASTQEKVSVDVSQFTSQEAISQELNKILSSIFGIAENDISQGDNLLNLGLDSLSSASLKGNILNTFGVDIPLDTLISGLVVKDLLSLIDKNISKTESTPSPVSSSVGYSMEKKLWLSGEENLAADMSIICFPYGGGSASIYKNWRELCPQNIAVYPIQFPGRENRIKESSIDNHEEMVGALHGVLENVLQKPFVLYGHSMGGLLAYCFAKSLLEKGNTHLKHLYVGGYTSPIISPNPFYRSYLENLKFLGVNKLSDIKPIQALTDEEVLMIISQAKLGFDVKNHMELARLLVPILFADMKIIESYHYNNDKPLPLPITAFHGVKDDRVTAEDMKSWEPLTTTAFDYKEFSGDHFFVDNAQNGKEVFECILSTIPRKEE